MEIFVSRLKPDTRIVYLKKWFWDKFQNARSVRFQALRTRYDTYASFKVSAKLLDEGDISEVLNCWKWPQELVLEGHKCPLVVRLNHVLGNQTDVWCHQPVQVMSKNGRDIK